jgi:hypothetical protein
MSDAERVSVSRRIGAPAKEIFQLITDPEMHVQIDGSGMLMAAPGAQRLQAVGDTFAMDMDREALGDIPLGKYKVLNTVTKIVPDTELEWNVGGLERGPLGHVYGYQLEAIGADETEVTTYCDWSGIPDEIREAVTWPVVPVTMLTKSLENLDEIATR